MESAKKIFPKESVEGDMHLSQHNELEIDVYKLIHLTENIPVTPVAVQDFEAELDDNSWTDNNGNKIIPKRAVEIYKTKGLETALADHPELSKHLRQIDQADYSHPIIIFESKVVDGIHRLAKAYSDGQISIQAKVLDSIPEEAIIKPH